MRAIIKFMKDEEGVTAIEYAILAAGLVTLVGAFTGAFNGIVTSITNSISSLTP